MRLRLCILIVVLSLCGVGRAQVLTTAGRDFWLAFIPNHHPGELSLLISGDRPTSGSVVSSDSSWSQTFSVVPGLVTRVSVPDSFKLGNFYTSDDFVWRHESNAGKGLHVTTDDDVSLYASNYIPASYDITNVLPTATLGQQYVVQTVPSNYEEEIRHSAIGVVATEDSTEVFFNIVYEDSMFHQLTPFSLVLNKGQTHVFLARGDMSGSRVWTEGCKHIAVFMGHECAYVPGDCAACDHLVEQAIPTMYWGRKFGITTTKYRTSDMFKITALHDNTVVTYDEESFVLNALESRTLNIIRPSGSAGFYLEGSKPISVFLYLKGGYCAGRMGDPSCAVIHPIEQQFSYITFPAYNTGRVATHCINIVTRQMYANSILLDNNLIEPTNFTPLSGNDDYVYARLEVQHGSHTLRSTVGGFVAHEYGLGDVESYAYAVGTSLDPVNPYSFLNGMVFAMYDESNNKFCLNDVFHFTSEVADEANTIIRWDFGDGDTASGLSVSHTYRQTGDYIVTVNYTHFSDCYDTVHYTHTLPIHVYDQAISVTDTVICGSVCEWNGNRYTSEGQYYVEFDSDALCDSVARLNINAFHIPPHLAARYEYDCDDNMCHLHASGDGDYLRWSSTPSNYELNGHEGDTLLAVTPNMARLYRLYMANLVDTLCGEDTSFYIPQIDIFNAVISVSPEVLDLDHTSVSLTDASHNCVDRIWYADGVELGRSQKVEYDYPVSHDSVSIELQATSVYDCHDTAWVTLRLMQDGIYVPNIITPNLPENNRFRVFGLMLMDAEIWIYNRLGLQVWHTDNIEEGWDGTHDGKDLPMATYAYAIRYRYFHTPGEWLWKVGTVTIVR